MRSPAYAFKRLAAAVVLGSAFTGHAAAQQVDVPQNLRVRLTLSGDREQRIVGVVLPSPADTLMVRMGDTVAAIARGQIRRVEVREAGHRNTWKGMLIGFAAGAVIGGVAGVTCPEDCQAEMPLILGAAGGGAGALVGGAIGTLFRSERWINVNAPPAISVGPARGGGMALGVSLRTR